MICILHVFETSLSRVLKNCSSSHSSPNAHGHHTIPSATKRITILFYCIIVVLYTVIAVCQMHPRETDIRSPLASAFELIHQGHDLSSTSAAQRMTESNSPPIRIHFLHRDAKLFHTIHSLEQKQCINFKLFTQQTLNVPSCEKYLM